MNQKASTKTNIHAGCVLVGRKGVLLLGPSGAGKSGLALRLIDEGARLVSDDRTDLFVKDGKLQARAPASIAGLMEVRGLGIIALPHAPSATVALAVQLGKMPERLPKPAFYTPLKSGQPVPMITLEAGAAGAPAQIRLALRAFSQTLFRDGFNLVPVKPK
jgi:HPr kinase/phosphorylase